MSCAGVKGGNICFWKRDHVNCGQLERTTRTKEVLVRPTVTGEHRPPVPAGVRGIFDTWSMVNARNSGGRSDVRVCGKAAGQGGG